MNQESLYERAIGSAHLNQDEFLSLENTAANDKNYYFGMQCNGYIFSHHYKSWVNSPPVKAVFADAFKGQRVAFFGPNNKREQFFNGTDQVPMAYSKVFKERNVNALISRYIDSDRDLASRIAFMLGGMARHYVSQDTPLEYLLESTSFVSKMAMLGDHRSTDALVAAASMYDLSGGPLGEDHDFVRKLYLMAEAVSEDPFTPAQNTYDLGLSQTFRLRRYLQKINGQEETPLPIEQKDVEAFAGFPTTGAEFHFLPGMVNVVPDLWKKLAILNMSQYQPGSYVQFSRTDKDIIEIRMNPSIYPVTIADWQHMRRVLPELGTSFFTFTINNFDMRDLNWDDSINKNLVYRLKGLGLLTYAGVYQNAPGSELGAEINFGTTYLGQTVRVLGERGYQFTGNWGGGTGEKGQMGLYLGYGENLPDLAYYLSMALEEPEIISNYGSGISLKKIKNLSKALEKDPVIRARVFASIEEQIGLHRNLREARDAGHNIMRQLKPQ